MVLKITFGKFAFIWYTPKYIVFIEALITEINDLIPSKEDLYYKILAKRLNNPLLQAKTYWSVLKTFYNDKKIPIIPSLLIDDKFVTDI